MSRLKRHFYARPTLEVAKDLLGKYIVRKIGNKKMIGKIIETEAYIGPEDRASHAFNNKRTSRNEAEYLAGGHIYIYLVYGMYWQFNISTYLKDKPECVLIRGLMPVNEDIKASNGPGKLCRWLSLDKSFYGEDLTASCRIWLEDRKEKKEDILSCKRIGIDYAGPYWANRKLRFLLKDYQKYLAK